jgi:hypothetical protein
MFRPATLRQPPGEFVPIGREPPIIACLAFALLQSKAKIISGLCFA